MHQKKFRSIIQKGYELYIVVEIPYDQQQNYLASEDDDKNVCTDEPQQADSEQLELLFWNVCGGEGGVYLQTSL